MPIDFEKNDATRRVTLTVVGELTLKDLTEAADRQAAEHVWSYELLLDASDRTGNPVSSEIVRTFVEHNARLCAQHGAPGPIAVVVRDEVGYGMGRMFQMLSEIEADRQIRVFRSIEDARAWLEQPRVRNADH